MNPCPICQKPVDPLRASHVRVVGVRVIAYCSAACRDADAARAVGALSTEPAAGSPSAAPVAPTSAAAAKSAPVVAAPAGAAAPTGKDARSGAVVAAAGKDAAKSAPVAAPAKAEPSKAEIKAAEAAKGKEAGKAARDGKDAGKAAEPSKLIEPSKVSKDEKPSKDGKDGKDGKAAEGKKPADGKDGKDGKAAATGKAAGAADGKAAAKSAGQPASADAKAATAVDSKDAGKPVERNADEERYNTIVPPEPKSRKGLIIAIVLVLAVAGVAIWSATRSSAPPAVVAPPPAPAPVVTPPPPPPVTAAEANARAVEVLRSHLTVESFRVRRFAAAALGRLGDAQAIQTLLELLPSEQSEIAKLDIAYGLARAGNERGLEMLVTGLRSARRDVKGDAARLLASLKDPRAETTLTSLLSLSQFRLGAAEQLARLGNKQGIAVLERIRNDKPKPPDPSAPPPSPADAEKAAEAEKVKEADRLRATVALGYAGQKDVAEELRALLPNTGFNVGAAGALAVLGDPAARPVLVEQLRTPSLRVTAALSLRRLEPGLDPAPLLIPLMQDLESEKDVERVSVAETILLLTGPPTLAERD